MPRNREEVVEHLRTLINGRLSQGKSISDVLMELAEIDGEGSQARGLLRGLNLISQSKSSPPKPMKTRLSESELHHLHLIFAARHLDSKAHLYRSHVVLHRFALKDGVPEHSIRYLRDKWTQWCDSGDPEEFVRRYKSEIKQVSARLNRFPV
jgi:hypothetical protein